LAWNGKVQSDNLFSLANGELLLMLEKVTQGGIDTMIAKKPKRVI
jgi:hypothetical protein